MQVHKVQTGSLASWCAGLSWFLETVKRIFYAHIMNVSWQRNSHHFECIPPPSTHALLQENVDIVFAPKNGNVDVAAVNFFTPSMHYQ